MYNLELKEKEVLFTFDNQQHQLCWDGMVYTIRERTTKNVKKDDGAVVEESYFTPIAYYSNLGRCLDRMAELKLLAKKEYNSLSDIFVEMRNFKRDTVNEIDRLLKEHISRKNEIED